MNFQDIQYHIEGRACTIDHLQDEAYLASNCITGDQCIIENLDEYFELTLCHYFYELSVEPLHELISAYEIYEQMRTEINEFPLKGSDLTHL